MFKTLSRREKFFTVATLLVACIIQFCAFPAFYLGREHDDAYYVLAAEALARGSYRYDLFISKSVVTNITPGLPFLLLPVSLLFSETLIAYQIYFLLLLFLCNGIVWRYFRSFFSSTPALFLTLLFSTSIFTLFRSGVVMPEVPYLLLSLAILIYWSRLDPNGIQLGLALSLLYLIRPAAVALIGASWIVLVASRDWRKLRGAVSLPLLTYISWMLWSNQNGGIQENFELVRNYSFKFFETSLKIAASNFNAAATSLGYSFSPTGTNYSFLKIIGGGSIFLSLGIALRDIYKNRGKDPYSVYFVVLLGLHALWPWWNYRYMVPILPFIFRYSWAGLETSRFSRVPFLKPVLLSVILGAAFSFQGRKWVSHPPPYPSHPPFQQTYSWIKSHVHENEIVASEFHGREVLYIGKIVSSIPRAEDPTLFVELVRRNKIQYIFWEDYIDFGLSLGKDAPAYQDMVRIDRFLRMDNLFHIAYRNEPEKVTIFKVL